MSFGREISRRLAYLARRSRFQAGLDDEIQFHIESRAGELEAEGVLPEEALRRARREFGSSLRMLEDTRRAWQIQWIEDLLSDLRYAARAFQRNPGLALTAIVCLALGIGANTAIFSLTTSFLFSKPSCRDAASLVFIWERGSSSSPLSDYKFLRAAHIFEGVGGLNPEAEVNWREGAQTSRLFAGVVTDDFFSTVDVPFLLGRGIAPGETTAVAISERLWRSRFGSDAHILGRPMTLDGRIYSITGVLPADNRSLIGFGWSADVYVPALRDGDRVQFYARLPPGMTRQVAKARLEAVLAELDRIDPLEGQKRAGQTRITGVSGLDIDPHMLTPVFAFFAVLTIVVGLVLLIACANVSSLLLARASSRSQELAIRLSLGASRARIVRHLLAESLLLAGCGTAVGLMLNLGCMKLVSNLNLPLPVPIHLVVEPDIRLLIYSIAVAIASALVSGIVPALKAVRKDVNVALKTSERQTGRIWGLRGFLVAGQLAVSVMLLSTGFLFLHNLLLATAMNPGFNIDHTLWAYLRLTPERYKDPNRRSLLVNEALDRLRALPGVEAAAITRRVPLNSNCVTGTTIQPDIAARPVRVTYFCNSVGPGYFRAIGIPILRGREFTSQDRESGQAVVIVNETFARTVFPNTDPVGHTFVLDGKRVLIAGLAKDSKYFTLGESQKLAIYEPYFQRKAAADLHFLVRTSGAPSSYEKVIARELGGLDPSASIEVKPMRRALAFAMLPSQAGAALLGAMGLLGLVLAAIGLHGVLLYSVAARTPEIGLRVALGATPREILVLVCRYTFLLAGIGLAAGLALALFATRPLALFLVPGLRTSDPVTFLSVLAILVAVALAASLAPAIRALRVDPMTALRYE